jgi:hypothetical protein
MRSYIEFELGRFLGMFEGPFRAIKLGNGGLGKRLFGSRANVTLTSRQGLQAMSQKEVKDVRHG